MLDEGQPVKLAKFEHVKDLPLSIGMAVDTSGSMDEPNKLPLLKRATERVSAMEVPYSGVVYLGATPNEALC